MRKVKAVVGDGIDGSESSFKLGCCTFPNWEMLTRHLVSQCGVGPVGDQRVASGFLCYAQWMPQH
jgi:hypothetical protein